MKKIFLILIMLVPFLGKAQITLIPDNEFEQRLIALNIDSDGIVNGQILTADALNTTTLDLNNSGYWQVCCIQDFTGIEAFVSIEEMESFFNDIHTIDLTPLTKLKKLHLSNSMLSAIDLSGNTNLESLFIGNDYYVKFWNPNLIDKLDLSNNTKLKHISAYNLLTLRQLNMRNNNADTVTISLGNQNNYPYNICIEVDDPVSATNGTAPYNTWEVYGNHYFSDDCKKALNTEKFIQNNFKIYPNSAADYVSVEYDENAGVQLRAVQILDSSGKWVRSVNENFHQINVSDLSSGVYLFVIQTDKGNKTEKVMVK